MDHLNDKETATGWPSVKRARYLNSTEGRFCLQWILVSCVFCQVNVCGDEAEPIVPTQAKNSPVDLFLFQPKKYPLGNWQPTGLRYEDVWFQSKDGTKLHGWYAPVEDPRGVVLYLHGNYGNLTGRASIVRKLQSMNLSVFLFDYRGYGRSEGIPSQSGVVHDAEAARAQLASLANVTEQKIVLLGRSLGGAIAIQLASTVPPAGLVVESTFTSVKDVARRVAPNLAWLVEREAFDSKTTIAGYPGPFLQSHGDADRLISIQLARELFRAAKGRKQFQLIPNGGHNSPQTAAYYRALGKFIDSL